MDEDLIEGRLELHEERLDHYGDRIEALEADDKHAEGMRINWIVVALFALELVIGGFQVWWGVHHA